MRPSDLDYDLPPALVAQAPLPRRDASRLLVVDAFEARSRDAHVRGLPGLLPPSLFVVNDTRVIPARLRGLKETGGTAELLLVERLGAPGTSERWRAMARGAKRLRVGQPLRFFAGAEKDAALRAAVAAVGGPDGTIEVVLTAPGGRSVEALLDAVGQMPLPPYVKRHADARDLQRYQTVFASEPGAVAAPTAGLHFTPELLEALRQRGHRFASVTLHVGPGTFRPISADALEDHTMHEERFGVPDATVDAIAAARREGRPIVAVGTTVVRTLESAAGPEGVPTPGWSRTALFVRPPYEAKIVDHLLTNFHLPRSTLIALVMALGGVETTRAAYAHAVTRGYRFFSYGDAMLLRGIRGAASGAGGIATRGQGEVA